MVVMHEQYLLSMFALSMFFIKESKEQSSALENILDTTLLSSYTSLQKAFSNK